MKEDFEFVIIFNIMDEIQTEKGPELKIIKKDLTRKWLCTDLTNITDAREVPMMNGGLYKTRCEVYNKPENRWVTIKHTYKEIKQLLDFKRNKIIGLKPQYGKSV